MNDVFGPIEIHPGFEGKFRGSARMVKRADLQFNELGYSGQIPGRTPRNEKYYTFGRHTSGSSYIKIQSRWVFQPPVQ